MYHVSVCKVSDLYHIGRDISKSRKPHTTSCVYAADF